MEPGYPGRKTALIFSSQEQEIGRTEAVASEVGDGHYVVQGSYLSIASTWQIELLVRRPNRDDARLLFTVQPSQLAGGSHAEQHESH